MAPAAPLGNLVRLLPLQLSELPAHPALTKIDRTPKVVNPAAQGHTNNADTDGGAISQKRATRDLPQQPLSDDSGFPSQAQVRDEATLSKFDEGGRPRLRPFVKEVLDQATIFVDDTLPVTFSQDKEKSSDPAVAKVRLVKRDIDISQLSRIPWTTSSIPRKTSSPTGLQSEAWFGRRSRHVNQRQEGTADFMEFEQGLMADHSKHEKDYTPDVFDAHQVMNWDAETVSSAFTFGGSYAQIRMCIYEMCHKLPWPLSPRVFPVLVVTAKTDKSSFIVVQIPVSIESLPDSFYSNGRNIREGDSVVKQKKPVLGVYTSIERCRILPDSNIEWIMATASDAKGWLPMWAQKLGVPGAVVKDVGLFIKWVQHRRNSAASE